jgi:hypothetical protein
MKKSEKTTNDKKTCGWLCSNFRETLIAVVVVTLLGAAVYHAEKSHKRGTLLPVSESEHQDLHDSLLLKITEIFSPVIENLLDHGSQIPFEGSVTIPVSWGDLEGIFILRVDEEGYLRLFESSTLRSNLLTLAIQSSASFRFRNRLSETPTEWHFLFKHPDRWSVLAPCTAGEEVNYRFTIITP